MNDDTFSYLNLNNNISDMFFEEDSTIFICIYNISFVIIEDKASSASLNTKSCNELSTD